MQQQSNVPHFFSFKTAADAIVCIVPTDKLEITKKRESKSKLIMDFVGLAELSYKNKTCLGILFLIALSTLVVPEFYENQNDEAVDILESFDLVDQDQLRQALDRVSVKQGKISCIVLKVLTVQFSFICSLWTETLGQGLESNQDLPGWEPVWIFEIRQHFLAEKSTRKKEKACRWQAS